MQAVNVGRETHQGLNVTLRSAPTQRMTLDANYTYLNRNISGTPGVFPMGTPKHKTIGSVTIRLIGGVTGVLSARYESGIVAMSDNGLPLPVAKFATVDVGGTVPIRKSITVQAGVRNLFDRNYYYWEGFPEEGRNWYATLRYSF
jgi:iron complex outermembrane receptor protein